jgi:NAD(P)-dependent dehydrogenase (short-subunit alcohol dehydrogenase family)
VLVNNAGYGNIGSIEDTELANFRAQIETNLFGVIGVDHKWPFARALIKRDYDPKDPNWDARGAFGIARSRIPQKRDERF